MKLLLLAALTSVIKFSELAFFKRIHLKKKNIGVNYILPGHGVYKIFRETVGEDKRHEKKVSFVVGFRLRLIGSHAFLHWVFQRVCIVTTPFWSGLRGFHIKLWMINPTTNKYAGIYEWYGVRDAQAYLDVLLPVLRFFSTKNSIWYSIYQEKDLATLLQSFKGKSP
jgi:hypothetical protein